MNFLLIIHYGDIMKPDLILWVEGYHDFLFFDKIIQPKLKCKYTRIKILEHSKETNDYINRYIESINSMKIDYIFIVDIDNVSQISLKKEKVKNAHPNIDEDKILVVIREIESWYAAGLKQGLRKHKISNLNVTDDLTKEDFEKKIPTEYTKTLYLMEILNIFSINVALKKNKSFNYCYTKYLN